jgi:WD40 repeat protein
VNRSIVLWDVRIGRLSSELHGHERGVQWIAFCPLGSLLASTGLDGTVRLWNWRTRQAVVVLNLSALGPYRVLFSPDGRRLACGCQAGCIVVWDVSGLRPDDAESA